MKTRAEVETLKRQWLTDACWDLELTEGFEDYREELRDYRLHAETKWHDHHIAFLSHYAESLGIPGNLALATKILQMQDTITRLTERIEVLEVHSRK